MNRRTRLVRALCAAVALVAVVCAVVAPARAQSGLSLAINEPNGAGDRIAAGRDFATEQIGDPWDMSELTDVATNESLNVSSQAVAGGVFSATTLTADPAIFLLDPGIAGSQRQGKTGKTYPVDTTTYRVFSIRMNVSVASSFQVFWYTGASQSTNFASSEFVATTPGWHIYTVDLQTTTITSGDVTSWSGQPATGIRLDPTTVSGSTFQIDWVRLTANGDASTSYTSVFTPVDAGSNAAIDLYLDDDANFGNGYIDRLATNLREDTATSAVLQLAKYAPRDYYITGRLSRDYASLQLEDPWDMSNAGDVTFTSGFASATVSGGVFSGTTNSTDPYLQMNVPLSGPDRIDSAVFRSISFQMTLGSASQYQVFWQTADGTPHSTSFLSASAGSGVYTVNLAADANWTGPIRLIRIDPATSSGISVSIDWVSVNTGPAALSSAPVTVTSTSSGPLTIDTPPILTLVQPDASGGLDYASFIRNNPWNMAEAPDVQLTSGLAAGFPQYQRDVIVEGVRGDYLRGQNANGNADPAVFYLFENTTQPIDANKYKNLTFRMSITGPRDVAAGSVARIFFQRTAGDASPQTSEDIIVNPGLNTFVFDMTTLVKDGGGSMLWNGMMKYFRIDPHEFPTVREFFIDDVKVAADDESNGRFAITWNASDPDDNATISLYRDNDAAGFNGALIVSGLEENDASNVYLWDTRGVANGTYYIYAVITDGLNTTRRYATGRLVVNNAGAADTTPPVGALETANTVTNASGVVPVTGWTLDNVQVASVQLLVDGTPVARPATGVFRPDIRDLNPGYPDCSAAGFTMTYDPSGLGPGTHSLTVAVYDTAGNRTLLGGAASGADTAGIYVPSSGAWFLRNDNSGGAADVVFTYGPPASTLTAIVGDWDGDGVETIGLYDPSTGVFFLRNSNSPGAADITFSFGAGGQGYVPLAGDWNGDGIDTIGLYLPSTGNFFLRNTNAPGAADLTFPFGTPNGYVPLTGDWNGDGSDTIGLYQPSTGNFFLKNTNASGAADLVFNYGPANSTPVVGDWNNDGVVTIGIYVPATGAWFLRNANAGGAADLVFFYGPTGVVPVTGDWNGATPKW